MTGRKLGLGKLDWQWKLTGLIMLILGAVFLIQIFYIVPNINNSEVENEQTHQEEVARNIARELDTEIIRSIDRLIEISERAEFRSMNITAQQEIMSSIVEWSLRLKYLFVIDTGGWFVTAEDIESLSLFTTRSYADKPYFFIPFEQGEAYCQEARYYPSIKFLAVVISVPIESDAGERVGVLLGMLSMDHFAKMLGSYPLEEGMRAYIVDINGTLIAHSDIDLLALDEGPLSVNYSDYPLVQNIIAGRVGSTMQHMHGDEAYFGTYSILESNNWGVVVERPMSLVMAEASVMSRRLMTLNGAAFIGALLVTLLFSRQIMTGERKGIELIKESEQRFRTVADFTYDWESWIGPDGKILYVSPSCERISGYRAEEFLVDPGLLDRIVHSEDMERVVNHRMMEFKDRGILSIDFRIVTRSGEQKWINHVCQSVFSAAGAWLGRRGSYTDITDRKRDETMIQRSLNEKEVLLRELHHRVKNNLQVISSVLRLQSRKVEDKQARAALGESQQRIQSIALIHEKLYQSGNLARIDFGEYTRSLVAYLSSVYGVGGDKVKIKIEGEGILLDVNTAMPCALIVNELVSNSFKYAFPGDREGEVRVQLHCLGDNELELLASDDGIAFPGKDFHNQKNMGFQLVKALVAQLGGTIELDSDEGTRFRIVFKQE